MTEAFREHIKQHFPFLKDKKLLLACSGGLDSMVLAHFLKEMKLSYGMAHCNFSLRGKESDGDESFVLEMAEQWDVPVYSETFDTKAYAENKGLSVQMAARELRYLWFEEIMKDFGYDYLLTAHHADDDLETFLINTTRGSGLKGLSGIPEVNGKIVRPLLKFSRAALLEYAKKSHIPWREDSSNAGDDYLRNQLRHQVVPGLKDAVPGILEQFQLTKQHLNSSLDLIEDYMALVYKLVISEKATDYHIDIAKLKTLPHQEALLYELLHPFGFTAWKDIVSLLDAQSGKQVVSQTHRLIRDRESLILTTRDDHPDQRHFEVPEGSSGIETPIRLRIFEDAATITHDPFTAWFDKDLLKFPLILRKWQEGDWFQPLGMKGKKKLSKFFKDEKLSLVAKEKSWVLCSDEQIIWVVGMRQDDRFKVRPETRNSIKIIYSPE